VGRCVGLRAAACRACQLLNQAAALAAAADAGFGAGVRLLWRAAASRRRCSIGWCAS